MAVLVAREARDEGGYLARMTIDNAAKLNTLNRALMRRDRRDDRAARGRRGVAPRDPDRRRRARLCRRRRHQRAGALDRDSARDFITMVHRCCDGFRRLAVPVIARIDGWALGAGLELAAACDLRVASDRVDVRHAGNPRRHSLGGRGGAVAATDRHGRARRLLLTGETIDAAEALAWGLVDAVAAPERLDAAVERFAAAILAGGPRAMRLQKR